MDLVHWVFVLLLGLQQRRQHLCQDIEFFPVHTKFPSVISCLWQVAKFPGLPIMTEKHNFFFFFWAKIVFAFTDLAVCLVAFQCTLVEMSCIENVKAWYLLLLCQTWPLLHPPLLWLQLCLALVLCYMRSVHSFKFSPEHGKTFIK